MIAAEPSMTPPTAVVSWTARQPRALRLALQPLHRRSHVGVQPFPTGLEVRHYLAAHAGVPELAQVIFDAGDGGLWSLGVKEVADLVGHVDETGGLHGYSAGMAGAN